MENNPSDMQTATETQTVRPTKAYAVISSAQMRKILKTIKDAKRPGISMGILKFEISPAQYDTVTGELQLGFLEVIPV